MAGRRKIRRTGKSAAKSGAKSGTKRALRARNPLALATRRLGRRVKPSAKRYRRQRKHPQDEES
jgi:hypothetical protein